MRGTLINVLFSVVFFCPRLSTTEEDESRQERYRLESDPSCGLVTGGSPECWWTCDEEGQFFLPPTCLAECYPADHCLSSLISDYQAAGGICRGSWADVRFPGLFQVSNQSCEVDSEHPHYVVRGLCSERTQELMKDQQNCVHQIFSQKRSIYWTTRYLIWSMCDEQTHENFLPRPIDSRVKTKRSAKEEKNHRKKRLTPIEQVYGENYFGNGSPTLGQVPPLENTKHRYPWICSLRSVGQQPSHLCGVTLLSRPPGPTVLVTSAHCVYICKSEEGRLVPNCCCPNVGPGLCTDTEDCGTNATTVEMTGAEAEVKCGEWDTATDTEEDYNVILPIKKIVVHPDFNISRGELNSQFVASDIAVIKVEDRDFEAQSRTHKIYPACLPSPSKNHLNTTAVHSGWSKPPPLEYVTNNAPAYEEFFVEFFKQWHYFMNITKCEDPKTDFLTGEPLKYPSNSYYPPGIVCAVEIVRQFCPTSGESGSPLMVTDDEGRMIAEGINSFIKVLIGFFIISKERKQLNKK